MKGGFRYEIDKCVSCLACVAACKLINGGSAPWRQVLSDNPKGYPDLPVHNLSIACNHCEAPACLAACPAAAYYIDKVTGAVLLSEERCIGCNYCYWSCPFDAPQLNKRSGVIEKCHFCIERQKNNLEPSCTSACPTGALSFDYFELSDQPANYLPATDIRPRIALAGSDRWPVKGNDSKAHKKSVKAQNNSNKRKISLLREWSLILFTYLSSGLFGLFFAIMNYPSRSEIITYAAVALMTLILPVFHLGKPLKAWRAITNISKSALSREIAALLFFVVISGIALLTGNLLLNSLSFAAGLVYLVLVDNVYTSVESEDDLRYHPGTVFLTGLTLASLFSGEYMALLFILLVQVVLTVRLAVLSRRRHRYLFMSIYILLTGSALIILLSPGLFANMPPRIPSIIAFVIIMSAEALNRIIYYFDFYPASVSTLYRERYETPATI